MVGASSHLVANAITDARGRPILADPAVAEQIAQAGGRVWIANPLDAFRRSDQLLYLDWLQGRPSGDRVLRGEDIVVVLHGSKAAQRLVHDPRFARVAADAKGELFVRASP